MKINFTINNDTTYQNEIVEKYFLFYLLSSIYPLMICDILIFDYIFFNIGDRLQFAKINIYFVQNVPSLFSNYIKYYLNTFKLFHYIIGSIRFLKIWTKYYLFAF